MSGLRRHSYPSPSEVKSESSCHACTDNVRALLDARRRIEDLTAKVASGGLEGQSPSQFLNGQLEVQLEEMKEIAGQLAELFRDLLAVLETNYQNRTDIGALGLDLLKCLAPVKGFGQILTDHYDRFESSVAAAGYRTIARPTVYTSSSVDQPRPLVGDRLYQEFSDVVAAYRSERSPLESDSDSASTGFSAARRPLSSSPGSERVPPPYMPSPSRVVADIGVVQDMPSRASGGLGESDGEDLGSFLDHLRRKSMRAPLPSPPVANDRDEEVARFLDRVIPPQGASSRSSVPAVPWHGEGWRSTSTRHRQTLA